MSKQFQTSGERDVEKKTNAFAPTMEESILGHLMYTEISKVLDINSLLLRHYSWMVLLKGWIGWLWRDVDACYQMQIYLRNIGVRLWWLQFILLIPHQVIPSQRCSQKSFVQQGHLIWPPDICSYPSRRKVEAWFEDTNGYGLHGFVYKLFDPITKKSRLWETVMLCLWKIKKLRTLLRQKVVPQQQDMTDSNPIPVAPAPQ